MVLPNNTFTFFLPVFFLSFGLTLLLFFGPVELSCTRIHTNQVNCSLVRSVAFGLLKGDNIMLEPLKLAKLDTQIKQEYAKGGRFVEVPVYDVVLVSDRDVGWGGYRYNHKHSQNIVGKINVFLADTNQTQLILTDRNYLLDILTVMMFSLSGMSLFKDI